MLIDDANPLATSKAQSELDKNVEGDLENVLNELNYDNEINADCCLQGGADSESMDALSALMKPEAAALVMVTKAEEDGIGKDTLAGYISDSVKATPNVQQQ